MTAEFRPPKLTSERQRAAEYVADRSDIYRAARALVGAYRWPGDVYPDDVLAVAQFLAGDSTE